jgi:DNA-binding response OmpR family regulator
MTSEVTTTSSTASEPAAGVSDDSDAPAGRVLVVDDEPMIREVLVNYLVHDGFEVVEAEDGTMAVEALAAATFDLVLLDIMLPGLTGLEVLRRIRAGGDVPVILLTARGAEEDRVAGLELGADDYVVKPFSPREVVARVRSVLRRTNPAEAPNVVEFGDVVVDLGGRSLTVKGEAVEVPRKEFDLLGYLVARPQQALTRSELLEQVWGSSEEWQDPATVTVHVSRLRQKLEADPSKPAHLVTVFGVGYRFEP